MVRMDIHSVRSNMFTIESCPPEARYLRAVRNQYCRGWKGRIPSPRVKRDCNAAADVRRRALAQYKTREVDDAQGVLRVVREHDPVADVVEHSRRRDNRVFLCGVPRLFRIVALFSQGEEKELVANRRV
jgi:hypothetical protein